jgi:hypothetical protein
MPKPKPIVCKLCGISPAVVPDRESGSGRKAVCRQCHSKRLLRDLGKSIADSILRNKRDSGQ